MKEIKEAYPKREQSNNEIICNHYKEQLIQSIDDFFASNDMEYISKTLRNSAFFIAHPEYASELDQESIIDILIGQIDILSDLSKVYCYFMDYYSESKSHQRT